ncbi:hypothetical protein OG455_25460 [Kitasatospora sp. NBC_01287]|uniref:S16 family serine protease n=1 Tax=Kitasatospora sp. NBC_01287 TaxID=2903573 RepID=UPI002253DDB2|nr:S16 family serine protease [Kitasatospora sp. NBC_01287]MCX4748823.1 hypothetical protein [Kitasatospora sp. NBC_01287]
MLFKHKHLLNELRQNGRSARAEILSVTTVGGGGHLRSHRSSDEDLSGGWMNCRLKLRVVPPNRAELPFEATVLTRLHTLKFEGGSVPVWYDPEDHGKVAVDYEADLQEHMHHRAESDRLAHRYDQRLGLAWTPVAGVLLPVAVTMKAGKGRLTATGRLGDLLADRTGAAVESVRGRAADFLPRLAPDWFARHDLHVEEPYGDVPPAATAEDAAGAALAVAVALVSLLGGHLVRTDVAVTGGLAPTGDLLPVTGLKDRLAAAKRGYAEHLVLPARHKPDLAQMGERRLSGLEFALAPTLDEALRSALARRPLKGYLPPA